MLKDFKAFLLRGNVMELAIAVVIGVAFKAIIDSLVADIVMPIIGIVGGKPSFDEYTITINDSVIRWGSFVTEVVSFVIIAAALFIIMKGIEKVQQLRKEAGEEPESLTVEGELLTEIRDILRAQQG